MRQRGWYRQADRRLPRLRSQLSLTRCRRLTRYERSFSFPLNLAWRPPAAVGVTTLSPARGNQLQYSLNEVA